jgi:hypothetical protein
MDRPMTALAAPASRSAGILLATAAVSSLRTAIHDYLTFFRLDTDNVAQALSVKHRRRVTSAAISEADRGQ